MRAAAQHAPSTKRSIAKKSTVAKAASKVNYTRVHVVAPGAKQDDGSVDYQETLRVEGAVVVPTTHPAVTQPMLKRSAERPPLNADAQGKCGLTEVQMLRNLLKKFPEPGKWVVAVGPQTVVSM